jgi:hypothetical protein
MFPYPAWLVANGLQRFSARPASQKKSEISGVAKRSAAPSFSIHPHLFETPEWFSAHRVKIRVALLHGSSLNVKLPTDALPVDLAQLRDQILYAARFHHRGGPPCKQSVFIIFISSLYSLVF